MDRVDGRAHNELRPVRIELNAQLYAEGSVIIETGQTRVLCAASVENEVPSFLKGAGQGWVTAEYGMLPRSTSTRSPRETSIRGRRGRTQEIQRLIGRSLRAAVDLKALGSRTVTVDCDVLQADGGTRTAAVTGAYIALYQALKKLAQDKTISTLPFKCAVAATSAGVFGEKVLLDLCYEEDSLADVDFNVVMTDRGEFVEIQGTAEGRAFSHLLLDEVLAATREGILRLFEAQNKAIASL